MNREQILANPLNRRYDAVMYNSVFVDFFDQTNFANFGYWEADTHTPREACENMMERLLDFIPVKSGRILDVACGKGGTTKYLSKHYEPAQLTAINISEKQLESARENVPGADFRLMDATNLTFDLGTFDAVICVEAAFHFNTRRDFLSEALRVLKPGGRLVLSDILYTLEAEQNRPFRHEPNFLANPAEYEKLLEDLGFVDVQIVDVTEPCWRNYYRYVITHFHEQYLHRQIGLARLQEILEVTYGRVPDVEYYLLVSATKSI